MTAPARLLVCGCALPLLAGCASSSSQAGANPAPAPTPATAYAAPATSETGGAVVGGGPDSDHAKVDASNDQIYQAEHANDPDAAGVSNAQNQGIP
jgi:hypothetical protein